MALTCYDLADKICDAIAESEAIVNKCTALFSKTPKVFRGWSGRTSSQPDAEPIFAVFPLEKEVGEDKSEHNFQMVVQLTVTDESCESETNALGVVVTKYRGPKSLEELLDLAMTEIRALSTELYFNAKRYEYQPIEYFPIFYGELTLTVSYPILIGGYEPTL